MPTDTLATGGDGWGVLVGGFSVAMKLSFPCPFYPVQMQFLDLIHVLADLE